MVPQTRGLSGPIAPSRQNRQHSKSLFFDLSTHKMRLPDAWTLLNPVTEFENKAIEVPGEDTGGAFPLVKTATR
jgi:hypothetical protein